MTKQTYKNEPIEITETRESALIATALGNLRAQSGADFFNEKLPVRHPARVTRQTVWNWLNGAYKPSDKILLAWRLFYQHDDPRYTLAVKLTKAREQIAAHWIGEPVLVPALTEIPTPATQPKKRRMRLGRDF